jgi:hypothetical protein
VDILSNDARTRVACDRRFPSEQSQAEHTQNILKRGQEEVLQFSTSELDDVNIV